MCDHSLLDMPLDVLINILTLLKTSDLRNLMLTCKSMKNLIINEGTLWRLICRNRLVLKSSKSELNTSWYKRCKISHNWCKGIYTNKVIIQHRTNYMPWLQYCDSEGLYLSVGSDLRFYVIDKKSLTPAKTIWSLEVPIIKRMDIRTNDISRFIVKDNLIICGNRDGSTAIYQLNDDRKLPKLLYFIKDCHQDGEVEVSAVEKIYNTVVTVSNNSPNVKFWQWTCDENDVTTKSYKTNHQVCCKQEIQLQNEIGCRCMTANKGEDKLAIGLNGNSKPLLLDVNTLLLWSASSRNVKEVVRDVQWHDENCIAFVTHSGKLQIIDARTSNVVYKTRDPFHSSLYCMKTDSNHAILVGSSEYSRCVLFDTRTTNHVQIYFTQKKSSPVYSLDFDSTKLLAAADRGVAALNFNVSASKIQTRDYSHTFEYIIR
ncbi:F-box/WD repeat-containing protein 4 isoform X2 [Nymphalis io]|uniref:F-box/WD repeat-containing protein 4 isoform X2 n=1 Tax=Inachis io TaxID=171585 RepID=UPI00216A41C5|nr:F-box/WD repeat-containing protein 4 isoform X2 [Nymphalis io]